MTRGAWRALREPLGVFVVALVGSAALWGRLWVTSPATRGVCGCGDPALFQWFLAWPAHALASGHSLVFSRDLFHPGGVNLLSNTSVLALGIPLAPVTWLGGPVLTENVALLLCVPVAALGMDLFLRRVSTRVLTRVVLAGFWGFSPFVLSNLTDSHLMLAFVGVVPLVALGVCDSLSDDARRARRGQVLLGVALVVQFFVSTELLVLSVLVSAVVLVVLAATVAVDRLVQGRWAALRLRARAVALAAPVGAAVLVLAAPAAYALYGPRALRGSIWGAGFNPVTGGSSLLDLVRAHATTGLGALSGYSGKPVVQEQLVGWGILAVVVVVAAWRHRDHVARTGAIVVAACLALSLSPLYVSWAPWQWLGTLPVLQDVVEHRIAVFALFFAIVVTARGADALAEHGTPGRALAVGALALAVVPVAVPEAQELPLHTVAVTTPAWWRASPSHGVVVSYPFPGTLLQSPLAWQAHDGFGVSLLGGSGPGGTLSRAGRDAAATSILDSLSEPFPFGSRVAPVASAATAVPVRAMLARDGVTEVVVPVVVHGGFLAAGRSSVGAAVFFAQVLGEVPVVVHDAWTFAVARTLAPPRFVPAARAARCEGANATRGPGSLAGCLAGGPS